jgi:hypothetical protein
LLCGRGGSFGLSRLVGPQVALDFQLAQIAEQRPRLRSQLLRLPLQRLDTVVHALCLRIGPGRLRGDNRAAQDQDAQELETRQSARIIGRESHRRIRSR